MCMCVFFSYLPFLKKTEDHRALGPEFLSSRCWSSTSDLHLFMESESKHSKGSHIVWLTLLIQKNIFSALSLHDFHTQHSTCTSVPSFYSHWRSEVPPSFATSDTICLCKCHTKQTASPFLGDTKTQQRRVMSIDTIFCRR